MPGCKSGDGDIPRSTGDRDAGILPGTGLRAMGGLMLRRKSSGTSL
jgi:hypothetical protein